jgi:hypothetical protein
MAYRQVGAVGVSCLVGLGSQGPEMVREARLRLYPRRD